MPVCGPAVEQHSFKSPCFSSFSFLVAARFSPPLFLFSTLCFPLISDLLSSHIDAFAFLSAKLPLHSSSRLLAFSFCHFLGLRFCLIIRVLYLLCSSIYFQFSPCSHINTLCLLHALSQAPFDTKCPSHPPPNQILSCQHGFASH